MSWCPELRRAAAYGLALLTAFPAGAQGLTLALGGDINLGRGIYRTNPDPFAGLGAALHADLTAANLESPLTDRPRAGAGIDLRAPPGAAAALRPFSHLGTVNNHALDGGEAGARQSRQALLEAGKTPIIAEATLSRSAGLTVALLAYLDDSRTPLPLAAVGEAAQRADLVVVLAHWGAEYGGVTAWQREQARRLVRAGADLVVGSGPHVLQGHEWIGRALVLYSLGNLLFDQPYPATWLGAVVRVRAERGGVRSACAVPTFSRAGRVGPAPAQDAPAALKRLGLPRCDLPAQEAE